MTAGNFSCPSGKEPAEGRVGEGGIVTKLGISRSATQSHDKQPHRGNEKLTDNE